VRDDLVRVIIRVVPEHLSIEVAMASLTPPVDLDEQVAAVIDACVLYKGKVTDFLLCMADAGLFDPVWSDEIHDEWTRNLVARLPKDRVDHRRSEMDRAYPGALCPSDQTLIAQVQSLCANDGERKDAHVIATARASGASLIVTDNIPDFRQSVLDHYGLRKIRPDEFCLELFASDYETVIAGARAHRISMRRSAFDVPQYLSFLAGRTELPKIAHALSAHADDL
jgi:hypothetical protein